ncbi:hypothetical protein OIU79_010637, partial [Salix purpurea]
MMGFKVQIREDMAICLLGHLYSYAISFSKTTLLPCSQDVKETAQTDNDEYRQWTSYFEPRRVVLVTHDVFGRIP